ncbi:MAG: hypothetical protein HYY18_19840 [Planctomycetes bacterium]|nr:hypothetical protein [Planctomycetota bacterium]
MRAPSASLFGVLLLSGCGSWGEVEFEEARNGRTDTWTNDYETAQLEQQDTGTMTIRLVDDPDNIPPWPVQHDMGSSVTLVLERPGAAGAVVRILSFEWEHGDFGEDRYRLESGSAVLETLPPDDVRGRFSLEAIHEESDPPLRIRASGCFRASVP